MSILDVNGRPRSIRTEDEELRLLLDDVDRLPADERAALREVYEKLLKSEDSYTSVADIEYKTAPVDIKTFLSDPYFLGETGASLWPRLADDIVDLFEGSYEEAALGGSLGWGKSFFSTTAMSYVVYQMSCLRNPQRAYGIDVGSNIYVAMISKTEKVARRVVINELIGKIRYSRYFQEHFKPKEAPSNLEVRFPSNIQVVAGSTGSSAMIGLNVFSGIIDETSFLGDSKQLDRHGREIVVDMGESIYKSIIRRMKSRFQRVGRVPGVLILASSKERPSAFIEKRIQQARDIDDPLMFVREYCVTGDTVIPLMNGTQKTIEELARDVSDDESFWVYSMDIKNGVVVPGEAHHPRLTLKDVEVFRVTIDSGESVRTTANHPFLLKDGKYKRCSDLVPGDSLMPLYRRLDDRGYEEIAQPWWGGRWQKTHHMSLRGVGETWSKLGDDGKPNVVHHKDFDKTNNCPENLKVMGWVEHQEYHCDNMDVLLKHVKSDKHREFSSENMKQLHKDPDFASRRNERGAKHLKKLRKDERLWAKRRKASAVAVAEFHNTEKGRRLQKERSLKRWDGKRKIVVSDIISGAKDGISITTLAKKHNCSPSAISAVLRRKGLPQYSKIKRSYGHKSPGNHKVVSVESCGRCDVYDMSVKGYENFAIETGIFLHNSTWDVHPPEKFSDKFFKVVVGTERISSRILSGDPEEEKRYGDLGLQIIAVPEDYRKDFVNDIDGSLREIAGVATDIISQYMNRTEKVYDCQDVTLEHPVGYDEGEGSLEEWVANTPLPIMWHRIAKPFKRRLPGGFEEDAWRPIRHPEATRFVHIDTSHTADSSGITIAHIAGWTEVVRRDAMGEEYNELAPRIEADLVLGVVPPPGDEIMLADLRGIVYQFMAHGFQISYASLDSYQSVDTIQQFGKHGIESEVVSVDRTTEPYDTLKTAMYEDRFRMAPHSVALREFRYLQRIPKSGGKVKIDHPKKNPDGTPGSKDIADSIAGVVYALTKKVPGRPIDPIMSSRESFDEKQDDSWVTGGKVLVQSTKIKGERQSLVSDRGNSPSALPFLKG